MKHRHATILSLLAAVGLLLMVPACTPETSDDMSNQNTGGVDNGADDTPIMNENVNNNENQSKNDNGNDEPPPIDERCDPEDPEATINVAGVFRYAGSGSNQVTGGTFSLTGTITFQQDGDNVRVSDTTYDSANLRRLDSEFFELEGNRLSALLIPIDGPPTYQANVVFVFSEDGNQFCVEFMDTNNDGGDLGSFTGFRIEQ